MGGIKLILGFLAVLFLGSTAFTDETCQSPYLPKIVGQEDYVYVWTLGDQKIGDGSDKLVVIDVNPKSKTFGKVVHYVSVGGRHEAHHCGFTDDRWHLWCGGLDDSYIFIFDIGSDPRHPRLVKVIRDFADRTGLVGPHTFYALPGRMLITGLSNVQDKGGYTGLAEYTNDGNYIRTVWLPKKVKDTVGDGYGYDVRVNANLNAMLTSSFTGWKLYMKDLAGVIANYIPKGEKKVYKDFGHLFGNTMVVWDFHRMKPVNILKVPGAPLEIRWALQPNHYYAFTSTALTDKLWIIYRKENGNWDAKPIADIGTPDKWNLPLDISISSDDRYVFVGSYDGVLRIYDVSDPFKAELVYSKKVGTQINMVSESWDGKRIYVTSSLLFNWDKPEAEHFLKMYRWDGKKLTHVFTVDFFKEKLGRPHIMRFGQEAFYRGIVKKSVSEDEVAIYR